MFLNEPPRTSYDFSFNLFGFPVRIHPGFFVLPFVFGAQFAQGGDQTAGVVILIFIIVFFVSILVHELGHSFALRYFGVPSHIVLYWFGGLAIHQSGWGSQKRLTSNQQIIVSLAGPIAGFALAGLFALAVIGLRGQLIFAWPGMFPVVIPNLTGTALEGNQSMLIFFYVGLFCNIFWNVLNLAPVLPLDGGQVSREICQKADNMNGLRTALIISVATAAIIAILGFTRGDSFMGIFFALLGISSYMTLQQMSGRGGGVW